MLGLATVALAAVSSITPASGETEPGGTASATVTVDSGILITCLAATSNNPTILVTFDDLPTCGTGIWFSQMEVSVSTLTAPGIYTVTVQELDLLGTGLNTYVWPLTVTAPATTTTLLPDLTLPTITLFPTTTTTTTTTVGSTGTTAAGATSPAPTTSQPPRTTLAPTTAPPGDSSDGRLLGAGTSPTSSSTRPGGTGFSGDEEGTVAAAQPSRIGESEPFSEISVTSGLIDLADRALPPVFAQAVFSPLVILEVLLRALGRTTAGLIVPLAMTVILGIGLARRLRHDAEVLPDLDDRVEIPVEDTGDES
jgi:hypothetical protein